MESRVEGRVGALMLMSLQPSFSEIILGNIPPPRP